MFYTHPLTCVGLMHLEFAIGHCILIDRFSYSDWLMICGGHKIVCSVNNDRTVDIKLEAFVSALCFESNSYL